MAEPTPEEQERIDALRAQVAEMGLPEGVEIDFVIHDDADTIREIAAQDAAVFVKADAFGWYKGVGLPVLPAIEISGLEWMERAVAAGTVTCSQFGIGNEIEGVTVAMFAHFRLSVAPLYIWIDEASEEWLAEAMRRFVVVWPETVPGKRVYIATGPMAQFDTPTVVPPNLGRNDPCPCGSGKKWKRCHGG